MGTEEEPALRHVDDRDRLEAAWNQLNLVLSFFSRIDTKLSVVLGLDLGMLALVGGRFPALSALAWWMILAAAIFAVLLGMSFYHLWRGAFPDMNGGTSSLVYFKSIGEMNESSFRQAYGRLTPAELADDLLNQVWRNSRILICKFASLRSAFLATLWAVFPWVLFLIVIPAEASS